MNAQLLANNFVCLPSFIDARQTAELAEEFFRAERMGECSEESGCDKAPGIYNHLPFVRLLVKKVGEVSDVLGEDVLPTYSYARIYKNTSELLRHTDRGGCEISLTVNLYQDAEWPIWIIKPNGEPAGVTLKPGDAMMYFGIFAEHWREPFTGSNYAQVFLHYVRAHGEFADTFFDKKQR
jgi:hypothetical protein